MADDSRFSQVVDAVWGAIQDGGTAGAALLSWRQGIQGGSTGGKDFDSGEIPDPDRIGQKDTPALLVLAGGALLANTQGGQYDVEEWSFPVIVEGVLRAKLDETTWRKRLQKFAELVWEAIVAQRGNCFEDVITGTNTIKGMEFGQLEFEDFSLDDPQAKGFRMLLLFRISVKHR